MDTFRTFATAAKTPLRCFISLSICRKHFG